MRAKFQVLVLCYIKQNNKFLVLKRADMDNGYQFVSGGGEGSETPVEAAKRELFEETGINAQEIIKLDSTCSIPANIFKEHRSKTNLYVVPEYSFAVSIKEDSIILSNEHVEYHYLSYDECNKILTYDSNKTALYELNERIQRGAL